MTTAHKTILVSDISGNPVTGITTGFTMVYKNNSVIDAGTTLNLSESGDGYYDIEVYPVYVGESFLEVKHSNTLYSVSPTWHEWTQESSHTVDQMYSRFATIGSSTLPAALPARFSVISLTAKQNTDIVESIQIPAS